MELRAADANENGCKQQFKQEKLYLGDRHSGFELSTVKR
jgi:hypothetical protein